MIDWLLKLLGKTTRAELYERMQVLQNQCDHYQWVLKKEQERLIDVVSEANGAWSDKYDALVAEMRDNGVTKAQLDEQAEVQLEMDIIRDAFDKGRHALVTEVTEVRRQMDAIGVTFSRIERESHLLRDEVREQRRIAKQQTSIAQGWQAHYEQLRDANALAQ